MREGMSKYAVMAGGRYDLHRLLVQRYYRVDTITNGYNARSREVRWALNNIGAAWRAIQWAKNQVRVGGTDGPF